MFKVGDTIREITKLMIREFKINELGYDFMGYCLQKDDKYNFHHMIIPRRYGGKYERWNGSILCSKTSHPYLHIIENKDYEMYWYITAQLIDMNIKGHLDIENLRKIHNLLETFERRYSGCRTSKGKELIKEEYTKRLKL